MEEIDNKPIKSKRDLAIERMKSKYPDKEFADDEEIFGQINDDFDVYDKDLSGYKEREGTFSKMFTSDPRSAKFITDWRNGEDPAIGLIRQFGTEIKEAIDDPDRQEAIAEANKEFVEKVAKEKELEDTYQSNLSASLSYLEELQKEKGLSDEDIDNAMEFLVSIVRDGIMGKFTPESIDMAMKAISHDIDVASAKYEGEVRGKNSKIEEKLRTKSKGDGTAVLDGHNGSGADNRNMPNLGVLDNYGENNQTIWERGGEKRKKAVL